MFAGGQPNNHLRGGALVGWCWSGQGPPMWGLEAAVGLDAGGEF